MGGEKKITKSLLPIIILCLLQAHLTPPLAIPALWGGYRGTKKGHPAPGSGLKRALRRSVGDLREAILPSAGSL